jgi:hypothetical protein
MFPEHQDLPTTTAGGEDTWKLKALYEGLVSQARCPIKQLEEAAEKNELAIFEFRWPSNFQK